MGTGDSTPQPYPYPQRLVHSVEGRSETNNAYGEDETNGKLPRVALPNVIASSAAQRQTPSYTGVLARNMQELPKDFGTPATAVSYLNTAGGVTTA